MKTDKKWLFAFSMLMLLVGLFVFTHKHAWRGKLVIDNSQSDLMQGEGEQGNITNKLEEEALIKEDEGQAYSLVAGTTKMDESAIQTKEGKTDEKENKTEQKENPRIENGLVSWGFNVGRVGAVDTIIIHSVYNSLGGDRYDLDKILKIFKEYEVAPHYIIERSGKIHQLVAENNTAYHAGVSELPDGRTGVNNFSIGIEIINAEDDEPEKAQYQSLEKLVDEIKNRYKIKYVLGHSDIAPGRKSDPWNFDWGQGVEKKD